ELRFRDQPGALHRLERKLDRPHILLQPVAHVAVLLLESELELRARFLDLQSVHDAFQQRSFFRECGQFKIAKNHPDYHAIRGTTDLVRMNEADAISGSLG